jgi:hypothetical protein
MVENASRNIQVNFFIWTDYTCPKLIICEQIEVDIHVALKKKKQKKK